MAIPVIDIFAGPGGLAEGFSRAGFDIRLSVEMDEHAHQTLRFRSFCRKMLSNRRRKALNYFYSNLVGEAKPDFSKLTEKYVDFWREASDEALLAELGNDCPDEISDRIENNLGDTQDWVLLGGPPCQAYSIAGRSRMSNAEDYRKKQGHNFSEDRRHVLYKEYLRIVAAHAPSVFVMENVKGLLSSKHKGAQILEKIKNDLREPRKAIDYIARRRMGEQLEYELYPLWEPESYDLIETTTNKDFIVKTECQGLPQARHRLFIIGLRKDRDLRMQHLTRSNRVINAWDVLSDLPKLNSSLTKQKEKGWINIIREFATSKAGYWTQKHHPDVYAELQLKLRLVVEKRSSGGLAVDKIHDAELPELFDWFRTQSIPVVLNHEARGHMPSDLHRYLYSSAFASVKMCSPTLDQFPPSLLPAHKNVNKETGEAIFNDRFRTQCKERPSTTITSHIHKDGHYFIHPDTAQCRSLTVREAARLQTFPDDYLFCGPRTEQFKQVGNAVPPYLAFQVAQVIRRIISA